MPISIESILKDLSWEEFEDLCKALVYFERKPSIRDLFHPGAVSRTDKGADIKFYYNKKKKSKNNYQASLTRVESDQLSIGFFLVNLRKELEDVLTVKKANKGNGFFFDFNYQTVIPNFCSVNQV